MPVNPTSQQIRNLYDRNGAGYDRLFHRMLRVHEPVHALCRHRRYLDRPGMKVLDAGCGSGMFSRALFREDPGGATAGYYGFDISRSMLDAFRDENQRIGLRDVQLELADATRPGLLPRWTGFDLIVTCGMLEYCRDDLSGVLRQLLEKLQPDGRLVMVLARDNLLTGPLLQHWGTRGINREEIQKALDSLGLASGSSFQTLPGHPLSLSHLSNLTNFVVEVRPGR